MSDKLPIFGLEPVNKEGVTSGFHKRVVLIILSLIVVVACPVAGGLYAKNEGGFFLGLAIGIVFGVLTIRALVLSEMAHHKKENML